MEQASAEVTGQLATRANHEGWAIDKEQQQEWERSVELLQGRLRGPRGAPIAALREALAEAGLEEVQEVLLEYDLRRRGLRVDCVLLAPGAILVVEFKRSALGADARDQVMAYCTSLFEFHEETRRLAEAGAVIVPILATTRGAAPDTRPTERLRAPYQAILARPITASPKSLGHAIRAALDLREARPPVSRVRWLDADFSPSSTILDAAISLYGEHDVTAIRAHASPVAQMGLCTESICAEVEWARQAKRHHLVFLSGAPGAGKTLVGLNLAFDPRFRKDAVFVTGNAPLVDVLDKALRHSYQRPGKGALVVASGYAPDHVSGVVKKSTFKLTKAHRFLGETGERTGSADGALLVFDEAQRTYKKGKRVIGQPLADHEADLILDAMTDSYPQGAVIVALLGQNQAINVGERGAVAWFEAADRKGWTFAVSQETLALPELSADRRWGGHPSRRALSHGHLGHSLRFYRNAGLERWAHHLLAGDAQAAAAIAAELSRQGDTIWLTRSIVEARDWARRMRVGDERAGILASSQARRLAAYGLHVELKPDIATWMLASGEDFRSSNMLETVQNQYQIQGVEIDWSIVCWGADLRFNGEAWSAFKLSGRDWQRDKHLVVAQNGYRVLLTRARKGMVLFVPEGDPSGEDPTRSPEFYEGAAELLLRCGALRLSSEELA